MSKENGSSSVDHRSVNQSHMNQTVSHFNAGGRPLFARDSDKHMTPAPVQYKPDRFTKYENRSKFQPHRPNIPNDIRFKDFEEIMKRPGPGHYGEVAAH